jgi:hypothetical protein
VYAELGEENKCNVHICQSQETKKKKKKNKEQKNQSTIWVNRSYDNFKVKLVSLQAKVPLKWPHIL